MESIGQNRFEDLFSWPIGFGSIAIEDRYRFERYLERLSDLACWEQAVSYPSFDRPVDGCCVDQEMERLARVADAVQWVGSNPVDYTTFPLPSEDVSALRAFEFFSGSVSGGLHHRQRMCQPSGLLSSLLVLHPVVYTTGRGCVSPPGF